MGIGHSSEHHESRQRRRADRALAERLQREELEHVQRGRSVLIMFRGVPVVVMNPPHPPPVHAAAAAAAAPPLRPTSTIRAAVARLPTRRWSSSSSSSSSSTASAAKCGVCLSEYEEGDEILTLPCLHFFHRACVERWLLQNARCPICREPAVPE